MNNLSVLLYTVAFDPPGRKEHRTMARMLVTGLLRSYFSGRIVIFRNQPEPVFKVERRNVEEIYVEGEDQDRNERMSFKFRARHWLQVDDVQAVGFIDADCAALRNVDHLFPDEAWDILYQTEPGRKITQPVFNGYLV